MENFSDGGMLLNAKGMLLYDRYISSLGSLWALRHLEPDLLFLFKFLEAACVDSSVMNKTSGPSSRAMKPNPFSSLNHLTVPSLLILIQLSKVCQN